MTIIISAGWISVSAISCYFVDRFLEPRYEQLDTENMTLPDFWIVRVNHGKAWT